MVRLYHTMWSTATGTSFHTAGDVAAFLDLATQDSAIDAAATLTGNTAVLLVRNRPTFLTGGPTAHYEARTHHLQRLHDVRPGLSWGSLPGGQREAWSTMKCDTLLHTSGGGGGGGGGVAGLSPAAPTSP